jgi:hypothetical protein
MRGGVLVRVCIATLTGILLLCFADWNALKAQGGMGCKSSALSATVPAPTKSWNATAGTWVYTWEWTVNFTCPNGNFSDCSICAKNYFYSDKFCSMGYSLLNTVITHGANQDCGGARTTSLTTTFPATGVIVAGQCYSIDFSAAPYDSSKGNDCSVMTYTDYQDYILLCPPNGP